jgi:hypothetical protein
VIVISGALVLVALVLLVIGLIGPSLGFVYASIGASLAAFAFLVVGILQRRREESVGVEGAPTSAADLAAAIRTPETHAVTSAELATASGASGEVLVVEGRPRYHVAGCRYLTGKDAKGVEVGQAQADGFTACGVCKPDEALAAAPASAPVAAALDDEPSTAVVTIPATAAKAAKAPAKRATAAKAPAKAAKAPAKKAPAAKAARPPPRRSRRLPRHPPRHPPRPLRRRRPPRRQRRRRSRPPRRLLPRRPPP